MPVITIGVLLEISSFSTLALKFSREGKSG
jgi:hypothetical protein